MPTADTEARVRSFGEASVSAARRTTLRRLRRTNLDLLPFLHELLRTRSVTESARALGVSQPAVSRALRELRLTFDDALLVSLGRDAKLTDRAQSIVEPLARLLNELGVLLEPVRGFDPLVEPLNIIIRTADYVSVLVAPRLTKICASEAPLVDFRFVDRAISALEDVDALDFIIVPRPLGALYGETIESLALWQDEMICIAAVDDLRWGDIISQEEFQSTRHVVYGAAEERSIAFAAQLQPTAVLEVSPSCEVPNFLVLGAIVEEARCLALVPRRLAEVLARNHRIRMIPIDYPHRQLDIDAFWTVGAGTRRGHAWARDLLLRVTADFRLGSPGA